jgi:ribosome-associated translation inhibitor RaiA
MSRKGPTGAHAAQMACVLHSRPYMNIDITTEHVAMRPEWHDILDAWLQACRRRHPDVRGIDVTLRHVDFEAVGEAVDLVAHARGRKLRTATSATDMGVALYDALDGIERELALNEAIRPQMPRVQ